MSIDTGYEGQESEEKLPSPSTRDWRAEYHNIGTSETGEILLTITLDGESVGFIRLPDREHVIWFRERIQND